LGLHDALQQQTRVELRNSRNPAYAVTCSENVSYSQREKSFRSAHAFPFPQIIIDFVQGREVIKGSAVG
jgi:hypothetical protein